MRKINFIICLLAMSVLFAFTSCGNSGLSKKDKEEILESFADMRASLPLQLLGNSMVMTGLDVEDDQMVCTIELAPQIYESLSRRVEQLNSDDNIASTLPLMGEDRINLLIKKKTGLLYRYVNMDDDSEYINLDISAEKLKRIWNR
ncbi:MAG: hypothetical protein LUC91_02950 [Prevotella sp.]|nr:hypothetical protein [Prevotella sp.]